MFVHSAFSLRLRIHGGLRRLELIGPAVALMNSILYFLVERGADDQPCCGLKGFARETPQCGRSVSHADMLRRLRRIHRRLVGFVIALGVFQRQVARTASRPVARRSCWAIALTHSGTPLIIVGLYSRVSTDNLSNAPCIAIIRLQIATVYHCIIAKGTASCYRPFHISLGVIQL